MISRKIVTYPHGITAKHPPPPACPPSNYHVLLDGKSVVDQRTDGVFDRSAFDHTLLSDWVSIIDKTKILKMNLEEARLF